MRNSIEKHSLSQSIFLHLLPGALVGLCYFLLAPIVIEYGFPNVMALIIAGIVVLLPFELGFLLYQKKISGKKFFGGIVKYHKKLKGWQYILWVAVIFVLTGLAFKIFAFASEYLMHLFTWMPSTYMLDMGLGGEYSRINLIITYSLFFLFMVLILPAVEELYFRGYLLPRMPSNLKGWVVPIHSALFALYHTWTPWLFITRTIGVLPLIYLVKRKENIYIGIIAHCIINSIDLIIGLVLIMNL
ncbi:CPBP family intramembrane glutamic endopeptidase [Perlabentimonas gracilis]|uniref:CPBP family intramembrane glutamic endopeptidase n=1 Tax=Perlabentimonas gracilis TaxID=2715279 RepID=UPI0014083370|nr:CPBP family intramembrane glutamic endopeptidase [Perlabentimonas gracilis]NHB67720.1 CPBP family intramembrane metalloprotease [Perlabentimonas gracilis]